MTHIHIDDLDRSNGNGSRNREEDWLDETSEDEIENEWSSAATTFRYWEASAVNRERFKDLYQKQHGKGDSNRSTELPKMRAMADTKAFCSMLELNHNSRERVKYVMQNMDYDSNKYGGKSYEKIILAVISLVHDEFLSSLPPEEINYQQRLIFDDTYRDLMDSASLGSKELRSIREQIRTKTPYF